MADKKKSTSKAMFEPTGGTLVLVEDFVGDTGSLEPNQYARNTEARIWYLRTPNGLLVELADGRVKQEDDGTISVPLAISADGLADDGEEHLFWTGTIDHSKWVSPGQK